ncbi:MAG: inner membrane-spanning protein YciB [Candidatus Puniceispirillales bacterium]
MSADNTNPPDMMKPTQNKWRSTLEFGPLLVFFGVNYFFGIYAGTATLVIATILALMMSWHLERRIPKMAAIGCIMVVFFGGLTILMEDEFYIKIKPTVASLAIAGAIMGGYILGYNPIRAMMEQLNMPPDSGVWRELTFSFVGMMVMLAVANEIAWRNLTTEQWVTFKVFGLTGISLLFGIVIMVILHRYHKDMDSNATTEK